MNKIYRLILPLVAVLAVAACSDDEEIYVNRDVVADEDIPNVTTGTFPAAVVTAAIGDVVEFAPEVVGAEGVTAKWEVNGAEVVPEPTDDGIGKYTYTVDGYCRAQVKLTLTKGGAKVELESSVNCLPDMSKGFVVVTDNSNIGYCDAEAGVLYPDVYSPLNAGASLASDKHYFSRHNGRIYAMRSTNIGNYEHVWAIDASTLEKLHSASVTTYMGPMTFLNDTYAFVPFDYYGSYRLNLYTMEAVQVLTRVASGAGTTAYTSIVAGDKLFYNCASPTMSGYEIVGGQIVYTYTYQKLRYYTVAEVLAAEKDGLKDVCRELDIYQDLTYNFVKDAAGNVYTIGFDNPGHYLAKINPTDLTFTKTAVGFGLIDQSKYNYEAATLAVSNDGATLYLVASDGAIYSCAAADVTISSAPFIAADADGYTVCAPVTVHPQSGDLYVPYYKSGAGKIAVFDASGALKSEISCGAGKPRYIFL